MRNGDYDRAHGRRSSEWLDRHDLDGFLHRSWLKASGVTDDAFRGRPVIGICNSWSELVNCNVHLRSLAEAVKRGVLQAGGFPREFPVMSLGESLMKPTTMLYRNLMSMDVEESIRSYPLDGVVLLTGCDKTNPASILGACSANVPTIVVTGGPMLNGHWRGKELGSCSDCWHYHQELRGGRISEGEFTEIENSMSRSNGHCMTMGTASTMACMTEALGLTLPGGAAIPAVDSRRAHIAEAAGRQIVELVGRDLLPSDILSREAFENAIRALHAISGSTNAIIHLIAFAGRLGLDLPLSLFDELSRTTPWLVNLKPAGVHLMEDFYYAGGLPAVLEQIRDLLHPDALTVTGRTIGENLDSTPGEIIDERVIRPRGNPLDEGGSLVVLRGNLCPDGAVMKISAADRRLLHHEGRAIVFDDIHDLAARVDDPELEVDADSVMVLRNAGPVGAPGMPEWGHLPIPAKLLRQGVTDLLRISDARMSGTSYGAVVLHVAPESAIGGPLALVRNGDRIRLDVQARTLEIVIDDPELERRRNAWTRPSPKDERGYRRLYEEHVLQANEGCDLDFLRGGSPVVADVVTYL
ncbi:MAG: dihydroxy-acid dehydratase [Solirubrobacterales bacterium]|nr:dihydroxy-acid dehydratase [Solirubrobacterales bacterium]MBV9310619.1 dihydroxy-acid dehydratase [Solirubrobacterales bacterium]